MFGLLLYEMSVGTQAYEGIFSFSTVILGLYYQKLVLNIPAVLQHQVHTATDVKTKEVKACHRLCLQSILDLCTNIGDVTIKMLRARLSLCAGEESWAPLNLTLDLECLLSSVDASLVYWASGSRGLVVGTISPTSGKLYRHILAEAPTPESGLFANRRGKPIPIAVGHATAIDLCYATNQLWVGTENGLMGSVYVFNLPDMKTHHYIHLQDAVLSLMVVNDHMQHDKDNDLQFHVLVGLANGTIIKFMGRSGGQILNNPLHGPRKVIMTTGRKPCLNMHITSNGHLWCGCGNNIEIFDSLTLNSLFHHDCQIANGDSSPSNKIKGEVIVLMALSKRGVWTVSRRSTVLRLWDMVTGELRASFNVKYVILYLCIVMYTLVKLVFSE